MQTLKIGHIQKGKKKFIDFFVSGKNLSEILKVEGEVCVLSSGNYYDRKEAIKELTLKKKPELESGRCRLYVCSYCGDIWCGSITVDIEEKENLIIWKSFGWETPEEFCLYEHTTDFKFEKKKYFELFSNYTKSSIY
ncbi:MAG: hypothetical protein JW891_01595 [Candidatus Lokiarchaeota archaeon]|nr:hypothetical protein [Candidatus Lokiarchaeota archaeon]